MAFGGATEDTPSTSMSCDECATEHEHEMHMLREEHARDTQQQDPDYKEGPTVSTHEDEQERKTMQDSFTDGHTTGETHVSTTEDEMEEKSAPHEQFTDKGFAQGGYVRGKYRKHGIGPANPKLAQSQVEPSDVEEHYGSIADAILAKKKKQAFAEGGEVEHDTGHPEEHREGMVDIDDNAEEQPNAYYKRNEDEVLKENYETDMLGEHQPEDSNEHGDSIDSDEHDMVSAIRRKMKSKRSE